MASFSPMDPREVVIGRGRANAIARAPYVDAIGAWDAGRIVIEPGEDPAHVKRLLRQASRQVGIRVRSSWGGRHQDRASVEADGGALMSLYSAHDRVMASIPEPCPWCDELVLDEHASEMRADSVYHLGCVYEHELDQEGSHDD